MKAIGRFLLLIVFLAAGLIGWLYFTGYGSEGVIPPSVLDGAINYTGAYPAPDTVSYTSLDGQARMVNAYPGQVQVFFKTPISAAEAQAAIQANKGRVLGQIPLLGYYLVGVTTGSEGDFIASILRDSRVGLALPNIVVIASQEGVLINEVFLEKPVPLNVKPGITLLDYWIGQDHGPKVLQSAVNKGGSIGSAVQIGVGSTAGTSPDKVSLAIAAVAAGNSIFNPGQPITLACPPLTRNGRGILGKPSRGEC